MDGSVIGSILGLGGMAMTALLGWGIRAQRLAAQAERRELRGEIASLRQELGQEMRQVRVEVSNSIMAAERSMFDKMNGKYIPNMGANLTGPEIERRLAAVAGREPQAQHPPQRNRQHHVET